MNVTVYVIVCKVNIPRIYFPYKKLIFVFRSRCFHDVELMSRWLFVRQALTFSSLCSTKLIGSDYSNMMI